MYVYRLAEPLQDKVNPFHAKYSFEFEVAEPFGPVAPLFGPEGERAWAGKEWEPEFLYPQPANGPE